MQLFNLHLKNLIFESIQEILQEDENRALRRRIDPHLRMYKFLSHILKGIDNIQDLNKEKIQQISGMAKMMANNNTPDFFHQVVKADSGKINAVNRLFNVMKNPNSQNMQAIQHALVTAKDAVSDLVDAGESKILSLKPIDKGDSANGSDSNNKSTVANKKLSRTAGTVAAKKIAEGLTVHKVLKKLEKKSEKWKQIAANRRESGRMEAAKAARDKSEYYVSKADELRKKHGIPNIDIP